ncbi:MAG: hypothetical protein ACE5NP_00455 [Anaerolineae bacterium]
MTVHLAIFRQPYLDLLLSGEKTADVRLSKKRLAPFGQIEKGDTVLLKLTSGPVLGRATVDEAQFFPDLTPETINTLRSRYNSQLCFTDDFWKQYRDARYGTLIFFTDVERVQPLHIWSKGRSGWRVLDAQEEQQVQNGLSEWERIRPATMLTSIVAYPDRGPYGDHKYPGNCSGYLIKELVTHFGAKRVLDPAAGSGTTGDVCRELGVECLQRDLRDGFDVLTSQIPPGFDFIFFHPPYWDIVKYSEDPRDLSNIHKYEDFIENLARACKRLLRALEPNGGHLAVLLGDVRKRGKYYFIFRDLISRLGDPDYPILIKAQHNVKSFGRRYSIEHFIPLAHEYVLIWRVGGPTRKIRERDNIWDAPVSLEESDQVPTSL